MLKLRSYRNFLLLHQLIRRYTFPEDFLFLTLFLLQLYRKNKGNETENQCKNNECCLPVQKSFFCLKNSIDSHKNKSRIICMLEIEFEGSRTAAYNNGKIWYKN